MSCYNTPQRIDSRLELTSCGTCSARLAVLVHKTEVLQLLCWDTLIVAETPIVRAFHRFEICHSQARREITFETHLISFNQNTPKGCFRTAVAIGNLIVTRFQLRVRVARLDSLRLQLQRRQVKSRNVRLLQVDIIQVVTNLLSQSQFRVAVQIHRVQLHCAELHRVALFVLKRKLELFSACLFTVFSGHTQVDLETETFGKVELRAKRVVLVQRVQGLDDKVKRFAIA